MRLRRASASERWARSLAGPLGQDVNSRRDRGTAQIDVVEIWVCGDRGFALHLAEEARLQRKTGPYVRRTPAACVSSLRWRRLAISDRPHRARTRALSARVPRPLGLGRLRILAVQLATRAMRRDGAHQLLRELRSNVGPARR